jgi:hypothetical protein
MKPFDFFLIGCKTTFSLAPLAMSKHKRDGICLIVVLIFTWYPILPAELHALSTHCFLGGVTASSEGKLQLIGFNGDGADMLADYAHLCTQAVI